MAIVRSKLVEELISAARHMLSHFESHHGELSVIAGFVCQLTTCCFKSIRVTVNRMRKHERYLQRRSRLPLDNHTSTMSLSVVL